MKTRIVQQLLNTPEGAEAENILRSCVHCGFCNATCPTYQLQGDELDGPRGRIYLIKQALEGHTPTRQTQLHLDRCLTCRNCESTCPSGVQYSRLLDIGRAHVNRVVPRRLSQRFSQAALRHLFLSRGLFNGLLRAGQALRPLLGGLKNTLPVRQADLPFVARPQTRKLLLVAGCVQPGLRPRIDSAARIVFDRLGIACVASEPTRCCGSLSHHLNAEDEALALIRANIDTWWPLIDSGTVEAICMTASGCGVAIRDYERLLAHDAAYADKARIVSQAYRDPAEIIAAALAEGQRLDAGAGWQKVRGTGQEAVQKAAQENSRRIVFHPPCTLQHGLRLSNVVEPILVAAGYTLLPFRESHLCCGSAGTYSMTQKAISQQLRERKLGHITATQPAIIATANIGCLLQLQSGTEIPVKHWLELLV